MECFVHIGLQKCGSSTLQAWFSSNFDRLLEKGILYPKSFRNNKGDIYQDKYNVHRNFITVAGKTKKSLLAESNSASVDDFIRVFDKELQLARNAKVKKCFISNEDLSRFNSKRAHQTLEFLSERFDKVTVLAFIRPLEELIESLISTRALNGSLDFTKTVNTKIKIGNMIDSWSNSQNRSIWMSLREFPDVIDGVCRVLKIDRGEFEEVPRQNVALNALAVNLLGHLGLPRFFGKNPNRLRNNYLNEIPLTNKPRISRAIAENIQERHAESVEMALQKCKNLKISDLRSDLSQYPKEANFQFDAPPYLEEVRYVVERLNVETWLQRLNNLLLNAENMKISGDRPKARSVINKSIRLMDSLKKQKSPAIKHPNVTQQLKNLEVKAKKLRAELERLA